jgi:transcriptional regulator with XRE-family HTH domain
VKREQLNPIGEELTTQREKSALDLDARKEVVRRLVSYLLEEQERQGLQQQQLERASGLAKGSLSNIKARKSCTIDTFIALCHGLGHQPSVLASTFLDRAQFRPTLAIGGSVPVVAQPGVSAETLRHVTGEIDTIGAKRGLASTNPGRANTKVAVAKKNSHR